MSEVETSDVTKALLAVKAGEEGADQRFIDLVYDELRGIGHNMMRHERNAHTLQPTALVNEALHRLLKDGALATAENRRYFFGAAVKAMERVLVDHARRRGAQKRGADAERVPLDDVLHAFEEQDLDVVELHEALLKLKSLNERHHQLLQLRFFGGLTMAEAAQQLEVSLSTAESDFRLARAWLRKALGRSREA